MISLPNFTPKYSSHCRKLYQVGKTKTARLFADYICSPTDMLEVRPQEGNSTIGVEQVRETIAFLSTSPIEGDRLHSNYPRLRQDHAKRRQRLT